MKAKKIILYSSFTPDDKYFAIGTSEGCSIYSTNPFKKGFDLSKHNK